jgi:hypothetical protein
MVAAGLLRRFLLAGPSIEESSAVVYDPCGGWGGRMLGAALSDIVGKYICCEPWFLTARGLEAMGRDLQAWTGHGAMSVEVLQEGCEVVLPQRIGTVDVVLTSPPYFDLERYGTEATQSYVKFPVFEDWIQSFLLPMFRTAYICLRPGCHCIINITNTPSDVVLAGLEEAACRVAREAGFHIAHKLTMEKAPTPDFNRDRSAGPGQTSYQPSRRGAATSHPEMIYVFQKPLA